MHSVRNRRDFGEAGIGSAVLLIVLGFVILRLGGRLPNAQEAVGGSRQFAIIVMIAGVACGLASLLMCI